VFLVGDRLIVSAVNIKKITPLSFRSRPFSGLRICEDMTRSSFFPIA